MKTISVLERLVQGDRRPDAVVLMDLSPEVGLARAKARGDLDRFEREDQAFYDRVRAGYLRRAQANPAQYNIVNAAKSLDGVQRELDQLIGRWTTGG